MTLPRRALALITYNFWWKILALAIALVIWVMVASEPELSTFTTVRLEFRNLPENLEISSTPMEVVSLELRGPAGELRGPGAGPAPAVMVDMSGVGPGQRTFTITDSNVSLPRGVRLVRAIPSQVRFEFDRRVVRTVPVQPHWSTDSPSGYAISSYAVVPERLVIGGPASHVERVLAAITDPIVVPAEAGSHSIRVSAFVPDAYVRFQASPQVTVNLTVRKK